MRRRGLLPLVAAIVFIGAAPLLILPPFEGFDETAHYSYIRELADTHAIPIFGQSTIAKVVADYRRFGPMPYTSVPPYNANGGLTYETFFARPALHDQYQQRFRTPGRTARRYEPTTELNWEAQHPPLYYALLAPVMRITDGLSFNAQLFVLRLISYFFATLGLLIGVYGTLRFVDADSWTTRAFVAGALLYPFLVPMFVPEFGRVGNDSLCMFLVGVTWTALLAMIAEPARVRWALVLGIVLGLGLLTKAFFLPIGTGVCAYLFYRAIASRHDPPAAKLLARHAAIVAATAVLCGGWWYLYKFLAFNSITGGAELITLDAKGGLIANLEQHFGIRYFARGFVALFASAYYTGTWSLARLPEILYLPGVVLLTIFAFYCARTLRRVPLAAPEWAPVWITAPVVGGFMYFILARIALEGTGNNIAGWYLNVLAPPVALLFGLGMRNALAIRPVRWLASALAVYALLFLMAGQWAQAALFSGCAIKAADSKYYVFSGGYFCLARMSDVATNLSVIGWPLLAGASFVAGLVCLGLGVISVTTDIRTARS